MGGAAGMAEGVGEAGPGVDLDEQAGEVDAWEPVGHGSLEHLCFGGQLLGGQGRHDELAVGVEAGRASAVGEDGFEEVEGGAQLSVELG
jgi:hypothetical protein